MSGSPGSPTRTETSPFASRHYAITEHLRYLDIKQEAQHLVNTCNSLDGL
jgi:hypothetical protein